MIGRLATFLLLLIFSVPEASACFMAIDGKFGYLRGQIVDERTEAPVPGVQVSLMYPHTGSTGGGGEQTFEAVCGLLTDADGRFTLILPPGTWGVQFTPEYPAYDWEAYDDTKLGSEVTTFLFAGGEDVDLGMIPIGPPDFQILGATVTIGGSRNDTTVTLAAGLANNTPTAARLSVWVVLEEDGSCAEPCAPGIIGFMEPTAPITVDAPAGESTPFELAFSLPSRLSRDRRYSATLYAGTSRWDALAYSPERLVISRP